MPRTLLNEIFSATQYSMLSTDTGRTDDIDYETKHNYKSWTVLQVYVYDKFTLVIVFVS